ncbi:MAG: hypothetical protein WCP26_10230 [Actinomycetes bacterium]
MPCHSTQSLSLQPRSDAITDLTDLTDPTDPTDPLDNGATDYPGAPATPQTDDALTDEDLEIVSGGVVILR